MRINQAREDEERGRGIPRTEAERQSRHETLYPGTPLPPRGTGLGISQDVGVADILVKAFLTGIGIAAGWALFAAIKSKAQRS